MSPSLPLVARLACILLFAFGLHSRAGEKLVIRIASDDYHESHLKIENAIFYPDLDGYFGDCLIEVKFAGTYSVPRLPVAPEAIKKVTLIWRFVNAIAAAGPEGFYLGELMEYDLPTPQFAGPLGASSESTGAYANEAGYMVNPGGDFAISSSPGEFSASLSSEETVKIPVRASLTAIGSNGGFVFDQLSRRFAVVHHRYPILEVSYELNEGYSFPPDPVPIRAVPEKSWGNVQTIDSEPVEELKDEHFPGELTGQPVHQEVIFTGPKRIEIRITGLPGYRYSLSRSSDLEHPVFVESKDGDGGPLQFEIDDSMRSDPAAFFQVQASEIAEP